MELLLESTETDDRTVLYGVSDFHIGDDEITVFWPTHAINDQYEIDAEQHFENHRVVTALDSQAQDLQTLLDSIHVHDQENYDITILPSRMYPIYEQAILEIGHDDSFDDPTNYTPMKEVHA